VLLEKFVQRLFRALPPKPQRFARFQIGHYRQELLLLPQENLIHSHQPQCRSPSPLRPALQLSQVDRPYGARGQAKLPGHSSYRRALTGLSNCLLKTLAEPRLAGQQRHLLCLNPTSRTAHSVQLDHHRGAILRPRQIQHLSFVHLRDLLHPCPQRNTLVFGFRACVAPTVAESWLLR
jgi:hypothetical protein